MLEVAAKAWAAWKKTHIAPNRISAVAERVNAECLDEILVTTRKHRIESLWVKRNEAKILEHVERNALRKGAKRNAKG
jgi:hypothetical protein